MLKRSIITIVVSVFIVQFGVCNVFSQENIAWESLSLCELVSTVGSGNQFQCGNTGPCASGISKSCRIEFDEFWEVSCEGYLIVIKPTYKCVSPYSGELDCTEISWFCIKITYCRASCRNQKLTGAQRHSVVFVCE